MFNNTNISNKKSQASDQLEDNLEDESASSEGSQYAIQMELANQIFDAKLEGCDKSLPVRGKKKRIYMSAKMSQNEKVCSMLSLPRKTSCYQS
jgi:hypothetical protein